MAETALVKKVGAAILKRHWSFLNSSANICSPITSSVLNKSWVFLSSSSCGTSASFAFYQWARSLYYYKHSLPSSWTMIFILTKQQRFKTAHQLLVEIAPKNFLSSGPVLRALTDSYDDPVVNSHILSWIIIFFANNNSVHESLQVLKHMKESKLTPDLQASTVLLKSLTNKRLTNTAIKTYKTLLTTGLVPNTRLLNVLMHSFLKSGDIPKAQSLFSKMCSSPHTPPDTFTFNTLISLFSRKAMHYQALSLENQMKSSNIPMDIFTYNSLLHCFCREFRMSEAEHFFNQFRLLHPPNQATYTTLIHGYFRSGSPDRALSLFRSMESHGVTPGVVPYNTVLRHLCHGNLMKQADILLREMAHRRVHPDVVTCNTLINAYCKIGDMDSAVKVKCRLLSYGLNPSIYTHNALLHGFCRAVDMDSAKEQLFSMVDAGFCPGYRGYVWMVDGYTKKGAEEEVLRIPEEVRRRGGDFVRERSVYRAVVRRFSEMGNVKYAHRAFVLMKRNGFDGDSVVYTYLAYAFYREDDSDTASVMLEEMAAKRSTVTLRLYRALSSSFGEDGAVLGLFWGHLLRRGLVSKRVVGFVSEDDILVRDIHVALSS